MLTLDDTASIGPAQERPSSLATSSELVDQIRRRDNLPPYEQLSNQSMQAAPQGLSSILDNERQRSLERLSLEAGWETPGSPPPQGLWEQLEHPIRSELVNPMHGPVGHFDLPPDFMQQAREYMHGDGTNANTVDGGMAPAASSPAAIFIPSSAIGDSRDVQQLVIALRALEQYLPGAIREAHQGITLTPDVIQQIRQPLIDQIAYLRQTIEGMDRRIEEISRLYDEVLYRAETGQLAKDAV